MRPPPFRTPCRVRPLCPTVNQDFAGNSGSQFAQSSETTTFHGCDWKAGVSCQWPSWVSFAKPLSGRDARGSTLALLLVNNADDQQHLSFEWADVLPAVLGRQQHQQHHGMLGSNTTSTNSALGSWPWSRGAGGGWGGFPGEHPDAYV